MYTPQEIELFNIDNIANSAVVTGYFDWQISNFIPYIKGKQILEIGAGIGTISERLARYAKTLMVTDISRKCLAMVREKLGNNMNKCKIEYSTYALGTPVPPSFAAKPFQAVVCINVLEHIENDIQALKYIGQALSTRGKVLILVPALPFLYGSVDRALGHHRRYTKKSLTHVLSESGYNIKSIRCINLVGILGWWLNSRILGRKIIPRSNFWIFKYFFPVIKFMESVVKPPLGLSILAAAEKN